jgi:hypothetical protein
MNTKKAPRKFPYAMLQDRKLCSILVMFLVMIATCFMLVSLLGNPEDGGDKFLRNID